MNYSELSKIRKEFLENGCKNLNIKGCEEMHKAYTEALQAPGCSSCAKRRARNRYGEMIFATACNMQDAKFTDVFKGQ